MEEPRHAEGETEDIPTDQAVIDAAIGGDVQAFAVLYRRYVERVYRHVYYRVGNRADAEDLTQQVFLQAWRAIGRYQHRGVPFIAWLITIAHHLVVNFYVRAKAQPLELEPTIRAQWADPETQTFARYDRLVVRRAILRLRPEQQQVIIMRFIERFEYSDIATALGKSEGNIRVIQHRALNELRRLLSHEVKA